MANFYIEKITASGSGKNDSIVEFNPGLNVIYGRSNTGKTCIVKCINFIFGGSALPFSDKTGYTCVKMDVRTLNGHLTLERKLDENKISVISTDENIESGKYSAKTGKNLISSVWLKLMGIEDDHQIISNENFKTKHLTWRTFVHMLMVDEREIGRESSIILPKMPQQQTAFLSSLLFLFYDKDFSEFDERESKNEKAIRKAAVEKYINGELSSIAERKQAVTDNMSIFEGINVEKKIEELVDSLSKTEGSISEAMTRSKTLLDEMLQKQESLAECSMLFFRYQSLKSQYAADIKRLTFIVDGETAMHTVPHDAKCPFCDGKLPLKEQKSYTDAASAELGRIVAQLGGLNESEQDLVQRRSILEQEIASLTAEKSNVEALVNSELKPKAKELTESINGYRAYIQLQNELDIIHRLSDGWTTDLRGMQNEEDSQIKYKPKDFFDDDFWKIIDTYLQDILTECKYTPLVSARLSKEDFDIEVNGNKKAVNYGKGYCAFLNTVLALAFRKYLAMNAVYNPGIFVIDTPLLGLDEGTNNEAPESIQRALFQYFIDHQVEGQLIVVENINTIPKLDYAASSAQEIVFTRGLSEGRYGFLDGVKDL